MMLLGHWIRDSLVLKWATSAQSLASNNYPEGFLGLSLWDNWKILLFNGDEEYGTKGSAGIQSPLRFCFELFIGPHSSYLQDSHSAVTLDILCVILLND